MIGVTCSMGVWISGPQRAQQWEDLYSFVSVDNIMLMMEICKGECNCGEFPIDVAEAVGRLQHQSSSNDW